MNVRRSFAALLLCSVLAPASAFAQVSDADKGTARDLTLQGYDALKNKDFAAAADRFSRADSLYHAPTITLGLARARAGLGKLVSAQELYSKVAHESVPADASASFTNAVTDAQRELAELTPRVPGVIINVKGTDAVKVTLDTTDVPNAALGVRRPADPGKHVIRAVAVGFTPVEASITLAEGKVETVNLELKPGAGGPTSLGPAPAPAGTPAAGPQTAGPVAGPVVIGAQPPPDQPDTSGSARKTAGFVTLGIGAGFVVVGAAVGGLAVSKHSSIAGMCSNGVCPSSQESTIQAEINTYTALGNAATGLLAVGGAAAVTGIILVATAPKTPKAPKRASITPLLGLGYAGVQGSF